jgi:UDP-glucose 4-epimerase
MRVLITGGSGFIGLHVKDTLEQRGHEVSVFDRAHGDDIITPALAWDRPFFYPDVVIHLAGVLGTEELFGLGHEAIDVNVKGTYNVLQYCSLTGAKYLGITMPSVWSNLYQATKRAARDLANVFAVNEGLEVMHVRAFNVFGEGQKVKGVQKIIPTFASASWRNRPLPVWGDGTQIVDLIDVRDVAAIFADVAEQDVWDNTVVDAGTGEPLTVNWIARFVNGHTENRGGISYFPMRKGEQGAIAVATREGWDRITHRPVFDKMALTRVIDWYQEDRP